MHQPGQIRILKLLAQMVDEGARQLPVAVIVEIHRQERGINRDVAAAKPGIELDAIEDLKIEQVWAFDTDVCQVQVTMALADHATGRAFREAFRLLAEKAGRDLLDELELERSDDRSQVGRGLIQILTDIAPDRRGRPPLIDPRTGSRSAVKLAQPLGDRREDLFAGQALRQQCRQHPVIGKPAHLNRVLHHRSLTEQLEPATDLDHRNDPKVDIPRQSLVQADFLVGEELAPLKRREVQEAEIDRLLDFVDEVTGQEDRRGMGLLQFDGIHRVGIRLRPAQIGDNSGEVIAGSFFGVHHRLLLIMFGTVPSGRIRSFIATAQTMPAVRLRLFRRTGSPVPPIVMIARKRRG